MGNKTNSKTNDQFLKAVNQLKKSRNQCPVQKVTTHLQERYKNLLVESLEKQEMPKIVKKLLMDCIQQKVKKQDLTSTLSVLNSLRSNNAENLLRNSATSSKLQGQSKNVVIKFDKKKFKYQRVSSESNQIVFRQEDSIEGRVLHTGNFICKQLNKSYHPFRVLCKRFADILNYAYLQNQDQCTTEKQYDEKEQLQRKTVKQFCQFLVDGCLGIYKKWILQYTAMEQKKYEKWMYSLLINQIWAANQGYMLIGTLKLIKKIRVPLKLDIQGLSTASTMGLLQPKDFAIDEQLRIEGNFFNAIFEMSGLSDKKRPRNMLKQLQNIKNSICIDIDNYHKLFEKGQIYEVNGDNIMGIVAYVLSRVATKIEQISTFLLFLKMIYGQGIFYNMDTSSYMYSTIWGAIEYLEGKTFQIPAKSQTETDQRSFVNSMNPTSI